MAQDIRLIAFDLDGTLTQHKSPLDAEHRAVLEELSKKYKLLMVGAGTCPRIFKQMGNFPIDIIGNYGMQYAEYDAEAGDLVVKRQEQVSVDRDEMIRRATVIREKYNLWNFAGDTMEFHPSGMLTFPVIGTKAVIEDKLAYDPDRSKRRVMYDFVKEVFFDHTVFIGGSSSFDICPDPYCKLYALDRYLEEHGLTREQVVYCGDDYRPGGNDYDVHESGIRFIEVDDYMDFERLIRENNLLD